ncbi:phosphohistidine phosphatase SixA [Halomonas sp. TBZ9]|uniref:Phosphohistidine phosphatase SixA n=1 Tax=Vreelandella azerica TaxID=2732867 RepID=A0A7Y3TV87_9GAMM|nr:phosphohistidine phosphatase SixA [Halomonas azerica]NOG30896.1 phosphohistidine phosphatase SixA [Halomonas azerica]
MKEVSNKLLLMRHGEAVAGAPDNLRRLSTRGEQEVTRMARWLADRVASKELGRLRIIASPYTRAQQSAQAVVQALGSEVETYQGITPDDSPNAVCDWLMAQPDSDTLLLVSHMPLLGELTGVLTRGHAGFGVSFATAGVAELSADVWASGCAELISMTDPRQLS